MTNLLEEIYPYVNNKTVLDVGAVQHNWKTIENTPKPFIHEFLHAWAKQCIGIDIETDMIRELRKKGYDIRYDNAETMTIGKKFDTIFAGDVIEHLSNPSEFLKRAREHLKNKGTLIITTCNTFSINRIITTIQRMKDPPVHKQHTMWLCSNTLKQLLRRNGFKPKKIGYYYWNKRRIWTQKLTKKITGKENMYDMIFIIATYKK